MFLNGTRQTNAQQRKKLSHIWLEEMHLLNTQRSPYMNNNNIIS